MNARVEDINRIFIWVRHAWAVMFAQIEETSNISAKAAVHCPVNQADRQLSWFLKDRGSHDGALARLELRAHVPPLRERTPLFERPAMATITTRHATGEIFPSYAVRWAPEGGGPYPTFVGSLKVGATEDYEKFELILDGWYEPFIGESPSFDKLLGRRIAESMAANLLTTIARTIEMTVASEQRERPRVAR
jgi:hypothetical protein